MNRSYITIVSGLPRSGTSMMMQILEAGGIPILTDNIRKFDEDNPKGYYEFEPVKKTKNDPSWVPKAKGKAIKIIYRLIQDLPDELRNSYVAQVPLKRFGKTEEVAACVLFLASKEASYVNGSVLEVTGGL